MISASARPSLPHALLSAQSWRDCLWKDASVSFLEIPVLGGGAADGAGPARSRSSIGPDTELSRHLPEKPQSVEPGHRGLLDAAMGGTVSRAVRRDKQLCQSDTPASASPAKGACSAGTAADSQRQGRLDSAPAEMPAAPRVQRLPGRALSEPGVTRAHGLCPARPSGALQGSCDGNICATRFCVLSCPRSPLRSQRVFGQKRERGFADAAGSILMAVAPGQVSVGGRRREASVYLLQ